MSDCFSAFWIYPQKLLKQHLNGISGTPEDRQCHKKNTYTAQKTGRTILHCPDWQPYRFIMEQLRHDACSFNGQAANITFFF